jgi:hypothetical protein
MPAQFIKIMDNGWQPDGKETPTWFNLDAILYVTGTPVEGETITVYCSEGRKYYLAGEQATALMQALDQRAVASLH